MENNMKTPETVEVKKGIVTKVKESVSKIPAPVKKGVKIGSIVVGTLIGAAILGKHVSVDTPDNTDEEEDDEKEEVSPFD